MDQEKMGRYLHQIEINAQHVNREVAEFSQMMMKNPLTHSLINFADKNRPDLTPLHFGLLLYSAYKYSFFISGFDIKSDWSEVVRTVNDNPENLLDSLVRRNVNITSPYRYSAMRLAISKLSKDNGCRGVSVADIGCGFYPFGIGYITGEYLPEVENVEGHADIQAISYSRIEAIDLQAPDPVWSAASQWEPLSQMTDTAANYTRLMLESSKYVNFHLENIVIKSPNIPPVDYCFAANILYQIPPNLRDNALKNIAQILKNNGVLLTADFLPNGSRKRPFTYAIQLHHLSDGVLSLDHGRTVFFLENADCLKVRYL